MPEISSSDQKRLGILEFYFNELWETYSDGLLQFLMSQDTHHDPEWMEAQAKSMFKEFVDETVYKADSLLGSWAKARLTGQKGPETEFEQDMINALQKLNAVSLNPNALQKITEGLAELLS